MARLTTIPSLVLVGPTASGKSDVAHYIARQNGLGIISADAMMVYRGMNIGTAKPTNEERGRIPYLGIDLSDPNRIFSVFDYLTAIEKGMTSLPNPSMPFMAAGGTGLYVRSLVVGLDDDPGADPVIRREAEDVLAAGGFDALKEWCVQRLPEIERDLPVGDRQNPRRWIRAVERGNCHMSGITSLQPGVCVIGILRNRIDLENRIRRRVQLMYDHGLIEEVAVLRRDYVALSETAIKAIGYAEALSVLEGTSDRSAAMEQTVIRTRQYAKRQMTWFRNQLPTSWIEVKDTDDVASVAGRVLECWKQHDKND